jgi:hypothetical protein
MYGGAACPWRLVVGVLDVALEFFCMTVHWAIMYQSLVPINLSVTGPSRRPRHLVEVCGLRSLKVDSTAILQLRPFTLFVEPIELVGSTHYLGLTLDKRLTWSSHILHVRKKTA